MTLSEAFMVWRQERITVDQAEAVPILDHQQPLTDEFSDWHELKHQMRPGDELWTFRSPDEEWDKFMGWQGIVLVRDGEYVDVCVTAQN